MLGWCFVQALIILRSCVGDALVMCLWDVGDMVVFSNTCPHRSKKNKSNSDRRTLYYTYTQSKNGSKYNQYFFDKEKSKNTSKAFSEKKIRH